MHLVQAMPVVVVVAVLLQVRLGGMVVLAAETRAEMAAHLAPLREERVVAQVEMQALLGPVVVAGELVLAAQAARAQSGLKLQTAPRLAQVAAVAALVERKRLDLPALMAQPQAAVQVRLQAHPASSSSLTL